SAKTPHSEGPCLPIRRFFFLRRDRHHPLARALPIYVLGRPPVHHGPLRNSSFPLPLSLRKGRTVVRPPGERRPPPRPRTRPPRPLSRLPRPLHPCRCAPRSRPGFSPAGAKAHLPPG